MVRNHGISFGMFAESHAWMPLLLTVLTSLVAIGLAFWLARNDEPVVALALGAIIGGALGNIIDRARTGAVTDFLDFHIGMYHWPAFNVADSAIFIGVVILVLIGIVSPAKKKETDT
jgi:signal peptidase II